MMQGGMGFGMGGMSIFWLLLVIVAVLVVVWLIRQARPGSPPTSSGSSAEETLKQRYARGEIGREEFQRMLQELRK